MLAGMVPSTTAVLISLATLAAASVESPWLSPKPPMGFNNWSRFQCALNESLFTQTADAMLSRGLLAAGYDRLNLDDCWALHSRAADGSLQWDPVKFPHGIPWLSDYLKQRGFKLGIYGDSGNKTCGGYPGSLGYEALDAKTFSDWGVDFLKLDACNMPSTTGAKYDESTYAPIFENWHNVLIALPTPLVFSESAPAYFSREANLSDWHRVMSWVPAYGELARHSADIVNFATTGGGGSAWESVMYNYGVNTMLARYQRAGFVNDPDFLIPDHPGLTMDEKRSQVALWASLGAPLIISAWIPGLSEDEMDLLTNTRIIAVDQDTLGLQATLVSQDGEWDVLTRSLSGGERLLTILNRGESMSSHQVDLERVGLSSADNCTYSVQELWGGGISQATGHVEVGHVPAHGTAMLKIASDDTTCMTTIPTGMVFNTPSGNCLTNNGLGLLTVSPCNAADGQVWQVHPDGSLNTLSHKTECLTNAGNQSLSLSTCEPGVAAQQWVSHVSGNLVSLISGECLTIGGAGAGRRNVPTLAVCLDEMNEQIFGLPSGVNIVS
ncbi:uncharacterized protein PV06_10222 [Exophiala oligosperma]|uniref:Alpha-galactosidase n=1 Tax=Exophiala oligosperma TaxID=215243 RepID=A0A0D2AB58_9EURO|nr:uncharacterized protein PV06_10222 [Exophiala oligosperma]KIW37576.1 hypothetical protein PV06_10222 [Exophiala oligosperma]